MQERKGGARRGDAAAARDHTSVDDNPANTGGLGNEADPADDPRYERYLEHCSDMQRQGLECATFKEWLIQAEESY